MSVFKEHRDEIKTYEVAGVKQGRLLFAMAILSDCQEMLDTGADPDDVSAEINEVKELISSVIVRLQRQKKEKSVVVIDGGVMVDVITQHPMDMLVIDHDITDEDEQAELEFPDGEKIKAGLYEYHVRVDPAMVEIYHRQIPAA